MSLEDLYGGKICAALDRQHPRDLFDVKILFSNEGISDKTKTAFLVYLMSHNRPISELLAPNFKDLKDMYTSEFSGMTVEKISLDELVEVRSELIKHIHLSLKDNDRAFLLSFKAGKPDWSLFEVPHLKDLPGIQWKLKNIEKLSFIKLKESLTKLEKILSR